MASNGTKCASNVVCVYCKIKTQCRFFFKYLFLQISFDPSLKLNGIKNIDSIFEFVPYCMNIYEKTNNINLISTEQIWSVISKPIEILHLKTEYVIIMLIDYYARSIGRNLFNYISSLVMVEVLLW